MMAINVYRALDLDFPGHMGPIMIPYDADDWDNRFEQVKLPAMFTRHKAERALFVFLTRLVNGHFNVDQDTQDVMLAMMRCVMEDNQHDDFHSGCDIIRMLGPVLTGPRDRKHALDAAHSLSVSLRTTSIMPSLARMLQAAHAQVPVGSDVAPMTPVRDIEGSSSPRSPGIPRRVGVWTGKGALRVSPVRFPTSPLPSSPPRQAACDTRSAVVAPASWVPSAVPDEWTCGPLLAATYESPVGKGWTPPSTPGPPSPSTRELTQALADFLEKLSRETPADAASQTPDAEPGAEEPTAPPQCRRCSSDLQ